MERKRFTDEQIISILKENEAGISVPDLAQARLCRRHVLHVAIQIRRNGCSDAKKLRELEAENARLKRLLAEEILEKATLKDAPSR